jgi:hypothetical protein
VNNIERPLTLDEAAEFLSISPWQMGKYAREKLVKSHRVGSGKGKGSRIRIWKHDLIEFLESGSRSK